MQVTIENFIIETSENVSFDLYELKKQTSHDGSTKIHKTIIAYGITFPYAIKRIVHKNLHKNPNIVSAKQFIVEYKNEYEKVKKLYELEKLK